MSETVLKEAFNLLCLELIASGSARKVYSSEVRADCIVKVEEGARSFQNVMEWQTWQEVKDTPNAKWFAPCVAISPCGAVLLMKRTEPAPRSAFPRRIPAFFTDLKRTNFGLLDGRLVCHDYGVTNLAAHGLMVSSMPAKWWDLNVDGTAPDGAA